MKHVLLGAALLLPVHAWAHDAAKPVTPAGSSSVSGPASATVNNAVRSSVRNAVRNTNNVTVTQSSGAGPGGANTGWGGAGGRGGNAPDVILGSVSGGNPCGLGAGAGGSGQGISALLAWMWEGSGCQRNEDAKLLHNLGYDQATVTNRLCDGSKYRDALAYAGHACPLDPRLPEWEKQWRQAGYHQRDGGWER